MRHVERRETKIIPNQLHTWRFILLSGHTKIPTAEMGGWSKDRENKTFDHDSKVLQDHLTNGGNYGVCADKDRFIIAADTKEIEHAIETRLPKTFTTQSPRHQTKHFYYYGIITRPIQCKPTTAGDPCADIRYGNMYALAPDSIFEEDHTNYGKYKVIDDLPIASATEQQVRAALDEFIVPHKITEFENGIQGQTNKELEFPITNIIPNLPAYSQNNGELYGPHPTHGSTTGSNFHVNLTKNVWHCFRAGHESGGGPLELFAIQEGLLHCEDCHKGALRGDLFKQVTAKAKEKGLIKTLPFNPEHHDANQQVQIEQILNKLKEQYIFKTPTDTEDIYHYENGIYIESEAKIKSLLEEWLTDKTTTHLVEEILNHIRRGSYVSRDDFNKTGTILPVQNGLLNLDTQQVTPFTQDKIYTYKLTVKYDPTKQCIKFQKFLTEILDKDDIPTLQEYLGYCLLAAMPYHKMMWFHGVGRNGKGRVMLTVQALIGKDWCSNLNLEEFYGDRRFSVANLYGKMVNVASEPSTKRVLQTPLIKKITGEDPIDAEIKNKQKFLTFQNFAKFFILGNRFPRVNDSSIAFWDRVILLKFPYSFIGDKQIPDIEKQWTNDPDEMSGILNWFLEGLHRLNKNNKFTESKNSQETISEFKRASDSVLAFIDDQCIFEKGFILPRSDVYDIYKDYCDLYGLPIEDEKAFVGRVKQLPKVYAVSRRIEKENTRVWIGLKIKELPQDDSVDDTPDTSKTLISSFNNKNNREDSIEKENIIPVSNGSGVAPTQSSLPNIVISCPNCRAQGKDMVFVSDRDYQAHYRTFHESPQEENPPT
jgi:putative DNA primase/helicase